LQQRKGTEPDLCIIASPRFALRAPRTRPGFLRSRVAHATHSCIVMLQDIKYLSTLRATPAVPAPRRRSRGGRPDGA